MVPKFVMPGFMQRLAEIVADELGLEALLDRAAARRRAMADALPHVGRLVAVRGADVRLAVLPASQRRCTDEHHRSPRNSSPTCKALVLEAAEKEAPPGGLADDEVAVRPRGRASASIRSTPCRSRWRSSSATACACPTARRRGAR